jgi:hypothetical protein
MSVERETMACAACRRLVKPIDGGDYRCPCGLRWCTDVMSSYPVAMYKKRSER